MTRFYFLIVSLLLVASNVFAQNESFEDFTPQSTSINRVYENTNSKSVNQVAAKQWIAKTYGDYKSVLQFEDDDNGKIIIKGKSKMWAEEYSTYYLEYTMTIDSRDNKYRISLDDISILDVFYLFSPINIHHTIDSFCEPGKHSSEYNSQVAEYEQLSSTTNLKKGELKRMEELKNAINEDNEKVESQNLRIYRIRETIANIILSAKQSMNISDDF